MKRYLIWVITILLLGSIFILRTVTRYSFKPKKIFANLHIIELEFKNSKGEKLNIKKENDEWIVTKVSTSTEQKHVYAGNKEQINQLIDNIKNSEIVEIVSRNETSYPNFELDEEHAVKVTITFLKNKKTNNKKFFIGKEGGFSYEESYLRIEPNPEVLLVKGIKKLQFNRPYYEFCNKTILKSNIEQIDFFTITSDGKRKKFNKNLLNGTTSWILVETKKSIDITKVNSYLNFFKEFNGDAILDHKISSLPKPVLQINLHYQDKGEVLLQFYQRTDTDEGSFFPVRILLTQPSSSIEFCANKETTFGIYEFRYNDFKSYLD